MIQLKEYQERALQALRDYFAAVRRIGNADMAFYETTLQWRGTGTAYRRVKELPGLPYVCVRIPTGGGKTLVACHAVGVAQRDYLNAERCLVLWLVPSSAILEQTILKLQDAKHEYRLAVERGAGPVEVMGIGEALARRPTSLDSQTVIVVATMQAFRVEETEGRKVYEQSGNKMDQFSGWPEEALAGLERYEGGPVIPSLANLFYLRRPVVIVDEAHNARTDLSFATLARLNPSCILEFTATPDLERHPSNVLYSASAAELKAADMIKIPIRLETRPTWKDLMADAVAMRDKLEDVAKQERTETGEYLRPIMLIQAQPQRQGHETQGVDVVRRTLLEDFHVPTEQIAVATGTVRGLEGVDLFGEDQAIRYVITIQALREGWDCSFAYVLCSLADVRTSRPVEQILGRIMRLPGAKRKQRPELNIAYAFAASPSFIEAANALKDALVQNGFSRQEARNLVVGAPAQEGDLFAPQVTVDVPEVPPSDVLSEATRRVVSFDAQSKTMTVTGEMPLEVKTELEGYCATEEGRAAIGRAYQQSQGGKAEAEAVIRARPNLKFAVPVLAVNVGGVFEQFDESHLLDHPWKLAEKSPVLTDEEFPAERPRAQLGELTVDDEGRLLVRFLENLTNQMEILTASRGWSVADLVLWLDRHIPHADVPMEDSGAYLTAVVRYLTEERKLPLERLVHDKNRLRQAVADKIAKLRAEARHEAYQSWLFKDSAADVQVLPGVSHVFDPLRYDPSSVYRGSYQWRKHYYEQVGDLEDESEEFECAVFLDQLPEVESWIRNLRLRPSTAFWLQTATDKFYPDFVCALTDGRYLVVEYKGTHLYDTPDSMEKRQLGELWEKRSGGVCLFVMPKGKDFGAITAKIAARRA
jgi:type III restriction enzyme